MKTISKEQLNLQKLMNQNIVITEIMRLALLVNNVTDYCITIDYKGHNNIFYCEIANKGWYEDEEKSRKSDYQVNLHHDNAYLLLEVIKNYLSKIYMDKVEKELREAGDEACTA